MKILVTILISVFIAVNFGLADTIQIDGMPMTYVNKGTYIQIGQGDYEANCIPRTSTGAVKIPKTIAGLPVKVIGMSAFHYCTEITSIQIPNSVVHIGSDAFFACEKLTHLEIPDSVTNDLSRAMLDCDGLLSVKLPAYLPRVGSQMLTGSYSHGGNLQSLQLPESVTSIGSFAFWGQQKLKEIVLPSNVERVDETAFYNCYSLEKVVFPEKLKSIGSSAFANTGLKTIIFLGDVPSVSSASKRNDWPDSFAWVPSTAKVFVTSKWTGDRSTWHTFSVGTYYSENDLSVIYNGFDSISGMHNIALSCWDSDATLHYTTDGATPDENSPIYSSPLQLSTGTTLKFIAKRTDKLSLSEVRTYVVEKQRVKLSVSPSSKSIIDSSSLPSHVCVTTLRNSPVELRFAAFTRVI